MERLKTFFTKNGYTYRQIDRTEHAAIYQQSTGKETYGYEVIEIEVLEPGERFGKMYPERENYPPSEKWGTLGWTVGTIERANQLMQEIELKVKQRIENKQVA